MANDKYTILYARLSQDDGSQGESNSIQNPPEADLGKNTQRKMVFENLKFMAVTVTRVRFSTTII